MSPDNSEITPSGQSGEIEIIPTTQSRDLRMGAVHRRASAVSRFRHVVIVAICVVQPCLRLDNDCSLSPSNR